MRAVVQLVDQAKVDVAGETVGQIAQGLLLFLGVTADDTPEDALYLTEKVLNLRIFPDEAGKMNLSLLDISGELLVVSQFTLYGDCRKGRRPSFDKAAAPLLANELYEHFISLCRERGVVVATGVFQAEMQVSLLNHGPVTLLLDSKKTF
ncbi:MAG: D-aminoacyl-tRNA deacylase [Sporomusaceae bacterium]|nr:D-aminoacyl-tRNA deacylase [Sporomusaceae bacterium]